MPGEKLPSAFCWEACDLRFDMDIDDRCDENTFQIIEPGLAFPFV